MIVGIQTGGIGKLNIENSKTNRSSKNSKQISSVEFAGLMNLTSMTDGSVKNEKTSVAGKKLSSVRPVFSDKNEKMTEIENHVNSVKENASSVKKDLSNASTKPNMKTTSTKKNTVKNTDLDSKNVDDSMNQAVQDLKDEMKQTLGLAEDELQELLQTAGVSMENLLNADILKQFLLQLNGASDVDMLIDENLNNLVNKLLDSLEMILQQNGINPEEFSIQDITEVPEDYLKDQSLAEADETNEIAESDTFINADRTLQGNHSVVDQQSENVRNADIEKTVDADLKSAKAKTEVQVTVHTEQNLAAHSENFGQGFESESRNADGNAETILTNLNQAVSQALGDEVVQTSEFSGRVSQVDIIRQVVDQIKLNMSKDVNSLSVQLNPEQLGKLQIHVTTKNGVMQAQIIAENEAAKNAVESGLTVLRETFENQGLKVDAIEVMVGTHDFFAETDHGMGRNSKQENAEKTANRSGGVNLNGFSDDEINEDDLLETEMMKVQGNQVNYMA